MRYDEDRLLYMRYVKLTDNRPVPPKQRGTSDLALNIFTIS